MTKILILCLILCGCATTTQSVATCKAVDAATTLKILKAGGHERNPIAGAFLHYGALPFLVAEAAVVWIVSRYEDSMSVESRALTTVLACAPAAHNVVQLIR